MKSRLQDLKSINNWPLLKKRKFFWGFSIIWTISVYIIGWQWLYFIPFIIGDIIFWKTLNYTFWKKRKKNKDKPKSTLRSWLDAIIFAIIAATLLRTFFIEAYTIPTPSMEKSLLVGDFLFVSKVKYGPRVPMTPVAMPLVHHTIPFLDVKSYIEWISLPYHRMSGINTQKENIGVERYDCVVFNWPAERQYKIIKKQDTIAKIAGWIESENYVLKKIGYNDQQITAIRQGRGLKAVNEIIKKSGHHILEGKWSRPIDKKENYIKRCVGLPGDKIIIKEGVLFVNNEEVKNEEWTNHEQNRYFIKSKSKLSKKALYEKYNIYPEDITLINPHKNIYSIITTKNALHNMQKNIDSVWQERNERNIFKHKQMNPDGFLLKSGYEWNEDNYGLISKDTIWNQDSSIQNISRTILRIPAKGDTISLTSKNYPIYKQIIERYEGEEMQNDTTYKRIKEEIQKDGKSKYIIQMNYYWMMGDNRNNSADSRFWGFVPENHIVGKSLFIWMSRDKYGKGIRWERMYKAWLWTGIIILILTIITRISRHIHKKSIS